MAAAGATWKRGFSISRLWRKGWEELPVIMVAHCISAPCFLWFVGERLFFGRPKVPAAKYRAKYTVVRPGDPRIERINNESKFDKLGYFS